MKPRIWLITLSAVLAGVAIALTQNKVLPCITVLQDYFSVSKASAGLLSSIFCVMGILVAFPGAMIVHRIGAKNTGLISLFCAISGSLLGLFSSTISLLLVSRVIEGIGVGLISIAVPSIISMWFPVEKRGLPMGIWSCWQPISQVLCFFFGATIAGMYGWQGVWRYSIAFCVVSLVIYAVFVKTPQEIIQDEIVLAPAKASIFEALKLKSVWIICAIMFCFCFCSSSLVTWAAPCWAESFGLDIEKANKYISAMYIWVLVVIIIAGYILERIDRKKYFRISFFSYIITVSTAFLLPDARWIIVFIIIYPLVEGSLVPSLWAYITQSVAENRFIAIAVALFGLLSNLGMLIGPPIVGAVIESFGWHAAVVPISIVATMGALLSKYIHPSVINNHSNNQLQDNMGEKLIS